MPFSEKIKLEAKRRSCFRCCLCHRPFGEVHHIIPQLEGGEDTLDNAVPLCASCHDLFGGNPEKRKQIRQQRDHWWDLMRKKEELIYTTKDLDEAIIKEDIKYIDKLKEKAMALYHVVFANEGFEETANILFELVKQAQEKSPNVRRALFLDIESHKNKKGGFDKDMYELQKDFIGGLLSKYLSEIHMPLVSFKKKEQNNDLPDKLKISPTKEKALKFKKENPETELPPSTGKE